MADRTHMHADAAAGFTLMEMMMALAILLFGVTALLGALTSSVAQRRTTDARLEARALCDLAVHRIRQEAIRLRADATSDIDLEMVALADQTAAGFPGMKWSAEPIFDDTRPDLWLVRLDVQWLEDGDEVGETFFRVVPRQLPLGTRVLRFREQTAESSAR